MRAFVVVAVAVGTLGVAAPAHADPVCVPDDIIVLPPGWEVQVCLDPTSPQVVSFRLYVAGEHVASGWADIRTTGVDVRVYNDSNVIQVSAGTYTDEQGDERLLVCVTLALGQFINPIEECRDRPLPP